MNKIFYYDYFSLKDACLSQWNDEFFWPVSREETQGILLGLIDENKRIVNNLGNSFEGDCLAIYNQTWNPYIRLSNYLLLLKKLGERGFDIHYSDKSSMMAYLFEGRNFPVPIENLDNLLRDKKWLRKVKNFLLSVRYNMRRGNLRIWDHFSTKDSVYVMPDVNVRDAPSTIREERWVRITTPEEWLSDINRERIDKRIAANLRDIAHQYHDIAVNYMRDKLGLDVPVRISRDLESYQTGYLEHIAQAYQCIERCVAQNPPSALFVGTGKTFTRSLSLAVRKHGGVVRGHPHGAFICHSASHRPHIHEFSTVDEFAIYTHSLRKLFKRNISQFTPMRENQISFVSQNSHEFETLRETYATSPVPSKIKRVMILELQLWADDIRYELPETMVSYHFYYNLCKTLTDNGYEVLFKKRPKSWGWDGIDIFKNMEGVKVVHGSLEDPEVMNMADAIIFQYGLSSTFIPLVCSNKTLIYIDAGWEDWYPDVYALMRKRCSVLKCWNDESNRQCFDDKDLVDILARKPQVPNMELFDTYLRADA